MVPLSFEQACFSAWLFRVAATRAPTPALALAGQTRWPA
jgi:hypothetical protein